MLVIVVIAVIILLIEQLFDVWADLDLCFFNLPVFRVFFDEISLFIWVLVGISYQLKALLTIFLRRFDKNGDLDIR